MKLNLNKEEMKLTEQALNDFKKWYIITNFRRSKDDESIKYHIRSFLYSRLESEQFGVFVDFFDSVGIDVDVSRAIVGNLFLCSVDVEAIGMYKTRQEARTEAVKMANEIYNSK